MLTKMAKAMGIATKARSKARIFGSARNPMKKKQMNMEMKASIPYMRKLWAHSIPTGIKANKTVAIKTSLGVRRSRLQRQKARTAAQLQATEFRYSQGVD